jgi:hypothetical protein
MTLWHSDPKRLPTRLAEWVCSSIALLLFSFLIVAVSSKLLRSPNLTGVGLVNEALGALLSVGLCIGFVRLLLGGRSLTKEELKSVPRLFWIWFVLIWALSTALRVFSNPELSVHWFVLY